MKILAVFFILLLISSNSLAEDSCAHVPAAFEHASNIRKLEKKKDVPCVIQSKEQVKQFIIMEVKNKLKPNQLKHEGEFLKAIGFFPSNLDYQKTLIDLYTSQIAGYYDSNKKRFVMADWLPYLLQSPIVIHELVHALQDQHFNLESILNLSKQSNDQQLARAALIEGDATAVMLDYTLKVSGKNGLQKASKEELELYTSSIIDSAKDISGATEGLEKIMMIPYVEGLNLVIPVTQKDGFEGMNKMFANPPSSTEELLHPEKYQEKNKDYEIPSSAKVLLDANKKTYKKLYSDSFGEYFIKIWLEILGASVGHAKKAAAGWGGDLVVIAESKDKKNKTKKIIWYTAWDTQRDAEEFFSAVSPLTQTLAKSDSGSKISLSKSGKVVLLESEI